MSTETAQTSLSLTIDLWPRARRQTNLRAYLSATYRCSNYKLSIDMQLG